MHFRLTAANGTVLDEGTATIEMVSGALVIAPPFGQPLRIVPSDIVALAEPEPYTVRLTLAEGPSVELTKLGHLRTKILAELADARGDEVAGTMLLRGVGKPEIYPGSVDDVEAEIRLYDDALVVVPVSGDGEKIPYPFIHSLKPDPSGYRITLDAGDRSLAVHRLGKRTSDFTTLLSERWKVAAGRTSSFFAALLPGLGPIGLRGTSSLLRDGLAGARGDLDAIDATIWPALIAAATVTERLPIVEKLAKIGPMWIGFKQIVSVERAAEGVTAWTDSAITPNLGSHDGGAGSFGGGMGGMMGAAFMGGGLPRDMGFDGPFGAMGSMLAVSMLGVGGSIVGNQHQIKPRADVERGRLTAAHTDHAALSTSGDEPTVLAFVLCLAPSGHLIYEVLNEGDHATYVYRSSSPHAINRALDLVGFRVTGIYTDADSAGSPYRKAAAQLPALRVLRSAFVDRVIHTDGWAAALQRVLSA
jgi:hypothetical protein